MKSVPIWHTGPWRSKPLKVKIQILEISSKSLETSQNADCLKLKYFFKEKQRYFRKS